MAVVGEIISLLILEHIDATVICIDGGWGISYRRNAYEVHRILLGIRRKLCPIVWRGGGGAGGGALSSLDDQWCLQRAVVEVRDGTHFHELLVRNVIQRRIRKIVVDKAARGGDGDPGGVALGRKHRRYKNEKENKSSTKQTRGGKKPATIQPPALGGCPDLPQEEQWVLRFNI
ncbi:hypothetical protein BU15DRAFT_67758 [Melanogaster broomeanus]|nr:hypothetical protein BU15DRAFT_67758 [Melanogaster broomeanus]